MSDYAYVGQELDLFAAAVRWKAYVARRLARYVVGDVLEVGAGLGTTTRALCDGRQASWTCLEPDRALADRLAESVRSRPLPLAPEVVVGFLDDLVADRRFDSILYIDVLEHIEDDRAELQRAVGRLRPGGCVVVLCPAHPALFTPFDRAIGHHRRYTAGMYRRLVPAGARLERAFYLDSVGMLLSLGNRLLLRQSAPTPAQVRLWDRLFVPCSTVVDPLTLGRLGKSVVGVWRAEGAGAGAALSRPGR